VVTTQLFAQDDQALRARVLMLERRVQLLVGIVRLLFTLVRLCDMRLGGERRGSVHLAPTRSGIST
jgi:hypothetical protein